MTATAETWWKEAVVYQIYPISFFDSNGDGIGDLNGITGKLDYLKDLGVDVLWLSPIYKSPLADMGYDISDYRDIDPRYGTLEDWDRLVAGVHARGMKLMMDLVVNHSSDEHEWFLQSKSSKTNPKRDWYIWRPPRYDAAGNRHPPNNWQAQFQGSVWDYDSGTDEYYLHLYLAKQPDLNWENPEVREAVFEMMRFWLDRGCDGFRMDVINIISKAKGLPDAPVTDPANEYQDGSKLFVNGPHVHEYLKEMNSKVLSKYDIMTVGETPFSHCARQLAEYVLPANKELNMIFQFELVDLDSPRPPTCAAAGVPEEDKLRCLRMPFIHRPWKLTELREIVGKWQTCKREEGYWNAVFIENHDQARCVTRFGNDSDEWRGISAKLLAMMEITLGGTQYVFQGQEIGTKNFPRSWGIEEYKDVAGRNWYNVNLERRQKEQGKEDVDMSDILDGLQMKARDHGRIPVQWDSTKNAGFTTGTPWMRVNDDYETWNVAAQLEDPESVRSFWKRALAVRKENKVLIYGDFTDLAPNDEQIFAYTRSYGDHRALVVLNFTTKEVVFEIPQDQLVTGGKFVHIFSNYSSSQHGVGAGLSCGKVLLKGYEGAVYVG
ncbi:glycoside hydrolase family 13 protein [Roridomyces roridus]|uniref:Glycoside hydrolase family 13 protein n=1 Tax=Roridomyces roridus TaxID=1738132 RepID=A0AAD7BNU1_9AGAR|nr:glycoside hydrolase family 13 protein [Roridomyces roridus]